MEQKQNTNLYIGKKYRFEILKDEKKLTFTATLLESNENVIVFIDKYNTTYYFNSKFIQSATEIKEEEVKDVHSDI